MKRSASPTKPIVMTIGHSTRPIKEFIQLLKAHEVKRLVDVRTVPRSRHNPQFNRSQLSSPLHSTRLCGNLLPSPAQPQCAGLPNSCGLRETNKLNITPMRTAPPRCPSNRVNPSTSQAPGLHRALRWL